MLSEGACRLTRALCSYQLLFILGARSSLGESPTLQSNSSIGMQSARRSFFCLKYQGRFGNLALSPVAGSSGATIGIARPVTRPTISASVPYLNCRLPHPVDECAT